MRPTAELLITALSAVCPVVGASIGRIDDKSTWRIDFHESATAEQRAAAEATLAEFDLDRARAAAAAREKLAEIDRQTIRCLREQVLGKGDARDASGATANEILASLDGAAAAERAKLA